MKKLLLGLLFIASPLLATGPLYQSPNVQDQQEHLNIYKDLRFPKISTGTAQNFYITAGSATAFNISTGTATNWTTKNLTISPGGTISGLTGRILQQSSASCTTTKSTTLTTFQSTCLTASITPSSTSSKIIVLISGVGRITCVSGDGNNNAYFTIDRGGTDLSSGSGFSYVACNNGASVNTIQVAGAVAISYPDSPASVSSLTYTLQVKKGVGSQNVDWLDQNQKGVITLLEYL